MEELKNYPISAAEMLRANSVISKQLTPSNLFRYESLSQLIGGEVYVKHENQNPTGSFKIRGGINLMSHLKSYGVNGVITFSTGNHGLSVATSAAMYGLKAVIVVPEGVNSAKKKLIAGSGAEVIEAGENFDEAALVVEQVCQERGYYYVHPANEPHLINGVGTEFLEIAQALPDVDAVILPLGGGSEVAAAVVAFQALKPDVEIYAVQAKCSSAAYQSWQSGSITATNNDTFACGFATGTAYETTFNIYKNALTDFVLLSESEIMHGIAMAAYHTHNLVEGAGASTIMAALKLKERLKGKKVVLQFSGSNASVDEIRQAYSLNSFASGSVTRA